MWKKKNLRNTGQNFRSNLVHSESEQIQNSALHLSSQINQTMYTFSSYFQKD